STRGRRCTSAALTARSDSTPSRRGTSAPAGPGSSRPRARPGRGTEGLSLGQARGTVPGACPLGSVVGRAAEALDARAVTLVVESPLDRRLRRLRRAPFPRHSQCLSELGDDALQRELAVSRLAPLV